MRRLLLVALLAAEGCLSGASAPSAVSTIQVSSNASPTGVFVGDTVQVNAAPVDLDGNVVPVAVTYTSSNTSVATIDNFGKIVTFAAGQSTITIRSGGQSTALTLTVDGNVSGLVQVVPSAATTSLGAGGTVQFTATVLTTLGNPGRNKSVTWSTSDTNKALVSTNGVVTPIAATSGVSICATATDATSLKGCSTLTITATASLVTPVTPGRP